MANGGLEHVRRSAGEFLAVETGAQTHHVGRNGKRGIEIGANAVDLTFDGIARNGSFGPALGHHGAHPQIVDDEERRYRRRRRRRRLLHDNGSFK